MRSRRYSENTIVTYEEALRTFLKFFRGKPLEEIMNDHIINFNNDYILKKGFSSSYQNQVVNAIKLFSRNIQRQLIDVELIHRPKREKLLPNVLSKEEIKMILDATQNLKHKAMLSLIYACGLRCGEILRLSPEHLVENGTDVRYILEILGHSSSKMTEIYTHVSNKSIQRIVSPFDSL